MIDQKMKILGTLVETGKNSRQSARRRERGGGRKRKERKKEEGEREMKA